MPLLPRGKAKRRAVIRRVAAGIILAAAVAWLTGIWTVPGRALASPQPHINAATPAQQPPLLSPPPSTQRPYLPDHPEAPFPGRRLSHVPELAPTELAQRCGPLSARSASGVLHSAMEPIDSIVSVTFDASTGDTDNATKVEAVVRAMAQPATHADSQYFTFLSDRNAEFRHISGPGGCSFGDGEVMVDTAFGMDVVYTYVNDGAPSYARMKERAGIKFAASRTRDWNELLYSLRTVFHRGVLGGVVRQVHLVVADADQVPSWLNTSDARINVVLHRQIFPADEPDALPTFNSHAIESVLHRIPGLSRFFVYFNNDMLWGRRVSFFDYFRPLSAERQRHREARLQQAGCGEMVPVDTPSRVTVMFEPILYFENTEKGDECSLEPRAANFSLNVSDGCKFVPLRPSALFDLACRQKRITRNTPGELWRRFVNYNRALMFDRIDGFWGSHNFAHYPRLLDRELMQRMEEVDMADLAKETRTHATRSGQELWTTYVSSYYAYGHRRAVDSMPVLQAKGWTRPVVVRDSSDVGLLGPSFGIARFYGRLELPFFPHTSVTEGVWQELQPNSSTPGEPSVLDQKFNYPFVKLDRAPGLYHFCIMKSNAIISRYIVELEAGPKLFVTINDDILPRVASTFAIGAAVKRLLVTASGDPTGAPWET